MDIIERLWIAHGELPGRQLLMRDAITEIKTLRDENSNLAAAARIADQRNEELRAMLTKLADAAEASDLRKQLFVGREVIREARALLNTESDQ